MGLPGVKERAAIWDIVIEKYGRDKAAYDPAVLARASEHYTGAEIEAAFVEALHRGFAEDREPGELDLGEVLNESVPLAVSLSESIEPLRAWSKGRARNASVTGRLGRREKAKPPGIPISFPRIMPRPCGVSKQSARSTPPPWRTLRSRISSSLGGASVGSKPPSIQTMSKSGQKSCPTLPRPSAVMRKARSKTVNTTPPKPSATAPCMSGPGRDVPKLNPNHTTNKCGPVRNVTAASDTPECVKEVRSGKIRLHAWGGFLWV